MKIYGKIGINGYSKNNRFAAFILIMHKPYRSCVAFGVYDFEKNITFISKTRDGKKILNEYWVQIIKEILSTNDWNFDIRKMSYSDFKLYQKCTF